MYSMVQQQGPSSLLKATVTLDEKVLDMEVDTGVSLSLISESTFKSLWTSSSAPTLQEMEVKLCTYTGEEIEVVGSVAVTAVARGQQAREPLLLVAGSKPSLLGHDWFTKLHLNWKIFSVNALRTLANIPSSTKKCPRQA